MPYTLPPWEDDPSTRTPLDAANLLQANTAIIGLDNRVTAVESVAVTDATQGGVQYRVLVLSNGALAAVPVSATFPTAPTGLTPTVHLSFIWLTWTPPPIAASYRLYRNNAFLATITGATYSDSSGITVGSTYTYYVIAVNSYGMWSTPSTTISVFVDPALNSAPVFESITVWPAIPPATDTVYVHINGHDVDSQDLTYTLTTNVGTLVVLPNDPSTYVWTGS